MAKDALVFARIAERRDDVRDWRRTEASVGSEDIEDAFPSLHRLRQIQRYPIVA
jgi:hypothetical protein